MAQNFSDSLNSAFAIDDSTTTTTSPELNNLAQSVSEKKAAVDSQTSELQALEARIKEMDKRLEQKWSRTSSPARVAGGVGLGSSNGGGGGSNIHEPRKSPLGDTFSDGGVNVPGAAGNYYGSSVPRSAEDGIMETRRSEMTTTEPLVDRTINPSSNGQTTSSPPQPLASERRKPVSGPGGMESLSASTKSRWMPDDGSERVSDVQ